jgi:DNA-directed RNA polymerase subunit RPC12/RpoP
MNAPSPAGAPALLGTPAPCVGCGAPMLLRQVQSLHENPELWCQYCGRREPLPPDAAERHRHLRLRLMQLKRAREASEAPLRTFRTLNETWAPAIAIAGAMGVWQSYGWLSSLGSARALGMQAVYALLPLSTAVGMLSGWLGMRRVFARQLRPLLRARPPYQPGLAARCRNCGGDLPALRAPEVTCGYCGASNFLDSALTHQAGRLLAQEAELYRRRVLPWASDPALYLAPSRTFYRYAALGAGLSLFVALGIAALLMA